MQVALGAVYAWSVFRVPLSKAVRLEHFGSDADFYDLYFCAGHFAAFFGGLWLNRQGPRIVAVTGGVSLWTWSISRELLSDIIFGGYILVLG